jgi:hypothetical protein
VRDFFPYNVVFHGAYVGLGAGTIHMAHTNDIIVEQSTQHMPISFNRNEFVMYM